jgi:hypothetical protein
MNPFCTFMASTNGRIIRILAGLALIAWGVFGALSTLTGVALILIGALPLSAGIFDFCIFAPLFGCPLSGKKIRAGK